jgi:hypothetical protein
MAQLEVSVEAVDAGRGAARLAAAFFVEARRLAAGLLAEAPDDLLAVFFGDFRADFFADFLPVFFADFLAAFLVVFFADFFAAFFFEDVFTDFFADFLFVATAFFLLFLALTLFAFLDFLAIVVLLLPAINSILAGGRLSPSREVQSCEQQGPTFHQQSGPCTRYCR